MASLALPKYGWLYMLGIFLVLFLQILGIILYYFIRNKTLRILLVHGLGLLLILFLCFGVILFTSPPPLPSSNMKNISKKVNYIYKTDQEDRLSFRFILINRDRQRVKEVMSIINNKYDNLDSVRKYKCGMVLMHGNSSMHYKKAYYIGKNLDSINYEKGKWLKKIAYDRWQLSIGNKQKYGTQTRLF